MKPTQITELLANIKATAVSFFSILMFVALGVGVFLGITWSGPALQKAADQVYAANSFHNFQVSFPYGLTQDDLKQLSQVEGVTNVEPLRTSFQQLLVGSQSNTVKTQQMSDSIDQLIMREGTLPKAADEVALEAVWAESHDVKVGDSITFVHDVTQKDLDTAKSREDAAAASGNTDASTATGVTGATSEGLQDGMKLLTGDTFKVTALVEAPDYLSTDSETFGFSTIGSGGIDCIAWMTEGAFDGAAFYDGYPLVDITCDSLAGLETFASDYAGASKQVEERITALGSTLAKNRYEDLHSSAVSQIEDSEKRLDDVRAQIADGERQIADGEKMLEDVKAQVADGERRLAESLPLLQSYQAQYDEGEAYYNQKRAEYEEARESFDAGMALVYAARTATDEVQAKLDAEKAIRAQAKEDYDAEVAQAKADRDAEVAQAKEDRDAKVKKLDADLKAGKITQAEHDQGVADADAEYEQAVVDADAKQQQRDEQAKADYDKKVAESYARIDAACDEVAALYKQATGKDLPFPLNHTTVDAQLAEVHRLLDNVDDVVIEYDGQKMTVREAREKLDDAERQLNAARAELDAKGAQLQDGWAQYYDGQAQVEYGKQQIAEGEKKLEDYRAQLEDGKKRLADGEKALEDAKEQLGLMKEYEWSVMPRQYNGGTRSVDSFSGITTRLSYTMAALFIIVGLLVTYSAISRIVHEQITQIGTKKAVGFRRREITSQYLAYAALAVLAGAIVGAIVGVVLVEYIIGSALGARFLMGTYPPYFDLVLFLVVTALELALVLAATYLACRGILKQHAVELLKGEKPPEAKQHFYEKWGIWERLPLLTQTIVNNCVNDKRRVFSTVVGVAGCTALIVTAITLNNDVLASYTRQYDEVFAYNATAYIDPSVDGALTATENALEAQEATTTPVLRTNLSMKKPNGDHTAATINVPQNEGEFLGFYHVPGAGENGLGNDGVWMTQAYADHEGAKVGDEVILEGSDGAVHRLTIKGFFPYYLTYNEMVMSKDLYEETFASDLEPNALLVDTQGKDVKELEEQYLRGIDGFVQFEDSEVDNRANFDAFSSVSQAVVIIYLALSTLMAIVVLLNLNVMFIEEKKRDLIVLMINGFSVKDAKRYIYNDTIVLTALGIICGLLLGGIMGYLTVASIEPETASFVKDIDGMALLIGTLGSALLALVMSLIALRRIPKFSLTDINKF